MSDFVIACVGKPSAGKSSFLNAVTDATAKVGNYPFTTIEPNQGVAYFPTECPCAKYNKSSFCKPKYGTCDNGTRYVPVRLIDVAGLVPGASEGRGLGNKFLDDLRHADALIHVVDASGTTDENGKETKGYDPVNDIKWLRSEIHAWIYNNLSKQSAPADTLQNQLSGYGSTKEIVISALTLPELKQPIQEWPIELIETFVFSFIDNRFPTIVALNKIDHPDSAKNINKILLKYSKPSKNAKKTLSTTKDLSEKIPDSESLLIDGIDENRIVLTSALSECYLKFMSKNFFIQYKPGDEDFVTLNDDSALVDQLKPISTTMDDELERIRDLVLFRYFTTGTQQTIVKAVESLKMIPVYPVKNISNFTSGPQVLDNQTSDSTNGTISNSADGELSTLQDTGKSVFRDCILVKAGTTVRQLAQRLHDELDKRFTGAETVGNIQLSESEIIVPGKNNIICIKTKPANSSKSNPNSKNLNSQSK
ncbi:hypothetical protein BB561_000635 [Smittium simulii]|uniref:OBG-type G domain-containing protein n=1 Tax=Smittium simulii TaxID=133385 RepID=A0A2T9YY92_9FUNG|nr:hypothetical protein BB561_000635 [Smittium simulii]